MKHGNFWRDRNKPRNYVMDSRCKAKNRYSDQPQAMAAALVAIENPGTREPTDKLWVYRCPHCFGWHLTSLDKGPKFKVERKPS